MEKTYNNHAEMLLDNIEAIIFDVDGTLMDSMGLWGDVDRIYLERHGKTVPKNLSRDLAGMSIIQAADYFRNVLGVNESTEKMLADWNELALFEYETAVPMKTGGKRWLDYLSDKGILMAVGTSNTRLLATTALRVHGIENYFKVILTGEDVVKGKPDPYIYQLAAKGLGLEPSKCLVFEDVPAGIKAGLNAGMKVCAVQDDLSDYQLEEKKQLAHYYIESFEDIFHQRVECLR